MSRILINMKPMTLMIDTQYGKLPYQEWCRLEKARIGGKAQVVYSNGKVGVTI